MLPEKRRSMDMVEGRKQTAHPEAEDLNPKDERKNERRATHIKVDP
jgi:hypothetical protein